MDIPLSERGVMVRPKAQGVVQPSTERSGNLTTTAIPTPSGH